MNIDDILAGDDWGELFRLAMARGPRGVLGYTGNLEPFAREDIAVIIEADAGEYFGSSWVGAFQLRDGRFAFITGTCDVTIGNGNDVWDPKLGDVFAEVQLAETPEELIKLAMSLGDRRRLGLALPEDFIPEDGPLF